ncbi:PREDICTED: uncharacterized protein LOC102021486 isoform X3 [Chinchilla lanigera]|uniref:uncharacterized protein LOC102021486 isoform X3 n=1 Tax=Chinchilla lanigera TaxID=34839 RepID=UPI0006961242|nr:PREDICTED: uncharacterized protein LOC102021486 isoform X3 [Chinchilla lanigera]
MVFVALFPRQRENLKAPGPTLPGLCQDPAASAGGVDGAGATARHTGPDDPPCAWQAERAPTSRPQDLWMLRFVAKPLQMGFRPVSRTQAQQIPRHVALHKLGGLRLTAFLTSGAETGEGDQLSLGASSPLESPPQLRPSGTILRPWSLQLRPPLPGQISPGSRRRRLPCAGPARVAGCRTPVPNTCAQPAPPEPARHSQPWRLHRAGPGAAIEVRLQSTLLSPARGETHDNAWSDEV